MTLGLMQPYLFPYLGYFQLLDAVDTYVIYDDVQFIKGGWINRNNILIGKDKVLFTIALADASANKNINEITIKDDFKKLRKTIDMAYNKAPNKEAIMGLLDEIFAFSDKNLARFAGNSIQKIAEYCGLQTNILYSSDISKDNKLRAQDKVLAICHELKADTYINAIGGQELYDRKAFKDQGIDLYFLRPELKPYKQRGKDFVEGLSIIDVLMYNSVDEVRALLKGYKLV